ncbi:MAG: protein-(glutamine-N5) methyltransferase, release factor-specific [Gammaproteobacteria bacterium]|nr:MAG: protein-(glutamine-N5) methyltransferase, release factor-specific [Gammaproteobacteria bacterium]
MVEHQTCSIASAVEQGTIVLSRLSDSAKLDSQLLLAFALNKSVTYLLTWPENSLSAEEFITFQYLLKRRVNGEPIAYIVEEKEFWSLPFKVSPVTLIPRPDTEILVEQVLSLYADKPDTAIHCLDLGTGTGAIALALASEQPNWQIEAIDYSAEVVALAQENAKRLAVNKIELAQVKIYPSNWFEQVSKKVKFEVIVSNPPYIDKQDKHLSQGDVKFEPKSALVADNNGLGDIKHIAKQARHYLADGGYLLFEHGFEQTAGVQKILLELGYQQIKTIQDLAGHDRVTQALWLNRKI